MSRRKALRANPRRLLAALATILVAVGVTVASGASFTATTANPSNTFSAGTLSMTNSNAGAAILTASNMKPGDPATKGSVVIKNTGTVAGDFTLTRSSLTNSDTTNPMAAQAEPDHHRLRRRQGLHDRRRQQQQVHRHPGRRWAAPSRSAPGPRGVDHKYKFSVALDSTRRQQLPGRQRRGRLHLGRRVGTPDGSYYSLDA